MQAVPLKRRFTPIPDAYQKDDLPLGEVWQHLYQGKDKGWEDLLTEYRVVILAEAGAGKTYELESVAKDLYAQGKPAFFLRIEDIKDDFALAFEVGTEEVFDRWLGGADEAWFFLDSVDEIRLTDARAFEQALQKFALRIHSATQRTHIYISSRPFAWRPQTDRALIEDLLPFDPQRQEIVHSANLPSESPGDYPLDKSYSTITTKKSEPLLSLYQLAPLQKDDIRLFGEHSGIGDCTAFLDALERGNLFSLAQLPFDLRDLIASWCETLTLASRLDVLQQGIQRQLKRALLSATTLTLERAEAGVQLIAIAAVLTGHPSIRLPASSAREATDPAVLLPEWTTAEITAVLTSGIFGEPIYGVVRFRHREIRELLAACWVKGQLVSSAGREEIEMHIFRRHYNEAILTPRLRPILPWLILFDEPIRDRVIPVYPQVALEGGDATHLPLDVRCQILGKLIQQVLDPTSTLRGVDNSAIMRIARPDLGDYVLELIEKYFHEDDAMFILGRLAWQGTMRNCIASFARLATQSDRGLHARLISIRVVACLGSPDQLHTVWCSIKSSPDPIPRRLLAEIAAYAPTTEVTIALIIETIGKLEAHERYKPTGLKQALNEYAQRLPFASCPDTIEPLLLFAQGLLQYMKCEPHIEQGDCPISEAYLWLMSPALQCIERLISARLPAALSPAALEILSMVPTLRFWHGEDYLDRKSKVDARVPEWVELNDALFWRTITDCRSLRELKGQALKDDLPVNWLGHFWSFDKASFTRTVSWIRTRTLPDDQFVALHRAVRTYNENGKPASWLSDLRYAVANEPALVAALESMLDPPICLETQQYQNSERKFRDERILRKAKESSARADFVSRLRASPDIILHPPGLKPNELSSDQFHLLQIIEDGEQTMRSSRGSNWKSLIPEFGAAVAESYRDAAKSFWRAYKPKTRSEGADPTSIPYAIIFGLSGLDIELETASTTIGQFGKSEVKQALRYALWELNGFPRWFEALCRAWPKISREFIWKELKWELENSQPDRSQHYVLHDLVYYAPWLHDELGHVLYRWILQHQVINHECLRYCRAIMVGGGVTASEVATLAGQKIGDTATPPDQLAVWYAMRTDADPAISISGLTDKLSRGSGSDRATFGSAFCVALLGGRLGTSPTFGVFKTPTYLKQLYFLIHCSVRVADDIERAGKGVYSPTIRDDAQDARERLFALLAEIPGELAYQAMQELSTTHPEARYRDHMRARAYQRAVEDGDIPAWNICDVARLARRMAARADHDVLLAGEGNATA